MSRRTDLPWGSGWRKDAPVARITAGLVICLGAAVIIGCGTVAAPHSAAGPASAGSSSGCRSPASTGTHQPTARTLVITLAGNAKAYCARVGDKLRVDLRGTDSDPWLRPLVSGNAVVPIPGSVTAGQ